MKRKFHTPEQIIKKLREADAFIAHAEFIGTGPKQMEDLMSLKHDLMV